MDTISVGLQEHERATAETQVIYAEGESIPRLERKTFREMAIRFLFTNPLGLLIILAPIVGSAFIYGRLTAEKQPHAAQQFTMDELMHSFVKDANGVCWRFAVGDQGSPGFVLSGDCE